MDRNSMFMQLRQLWPGLEARGATALFVFGSRVTDTHRDDSDLDVFVDHDSSRAFTLLDLASIKDQLEDTLDLTVDVTTRDGLHPMLRAKIENEAVRVV